jgi:hypothetical protein
MKLFLIVLLSSVPFFIIMWRIGFIMGYKPGYRKGAQDVLNEWKNELYLEEDDEDEKWN